MFVGIKCFAFSETKPCLRGSIFMVTLGLVKTKSFSNYIPWNFFLLSKGDHAVRQINPLQTLMNLQYRKTLLCKLAISGQVRSSTNLYLWRAGSCRWCHQWGNWEPSRYLIGPPCLGGEPTAPRRGGISSQLQMAVVGSCFDTSWTASRSHCGETGPGDVVNGKISLQVFMLIQITPTT